MAEPHRDHMHEWADVTDGSGGDAICLVCGLREFSVGTEGAVVTGWTWGNRFGTSDGTGFGTIEEALAYEESCL